MRPTATRRPSTSPVGPRPGSSTTFAGTVIEALRRLASRTIACARTCVETWSTEAAKPSTSPGAKPVAAATSMTRGRPTVTVPVLSSTSVRARPSCSSAVPSRTITPSRDARESPETMATGAASSRGQGVATTRTATARAAEPLSTQARPAIARDSGRNHAA